MKLITLLEDKADKVSDTIKEMYPYKSQMRVTRLPVYRDDKHVPSFKESVYTIRLSHIGNKRGTGYIVELKRIVQVLWRGKTPIQLNTKKGKWEVVTFRLYK